MAISQKKHCTFLFSQSHFVRRNSDKLYFFQLNKRFTVILWSQMTVFFIVWKACSLTFWNLSATPHSYAPDIIFFYNIRKNIGASGQMTLIIFILDGKIQQWINAKWHWLFFSYAERICVPGCKIYWFYFNLILKCYHWLLIICIGCGLLVIIYIVCRRQRQLLGLYLTIINI